MDDYTADKSIKLSLREDGVYLTVDNTIGATVSRNEVITLIEKLGFRDLEFRNINELFSKSFSTKEILLTKNLSFKPKNEKAVLTVSEDRLNAYLSFEPCGILGKRLSEEEIVSEIESRQICFGLDTAAIKELSRQREYGEKYLIASGTPAKNGQNGYIKYYFDTSSRKATPKELGNGGVDFFNLQLFIGANKDQLLAEAIEPVPAENGCDVYGRAINGTQARPAARLHAGKNTELSEDGKKLFSSIDGQIIYADGKISVSPVIEINGDVGPETGDIDFVGAISVRGSVLSGFSIRAGSSVSIGGVVEGATVTSGEDILITGGVQGNGKAMISANGNVTAKFAESAQIFSGGSVYLESALHCDIGCDGRLELLGKKGLIMGGNTVCAGGVIAKTIGSAVATPTKLTIGISPARLALYKAALNEAKNIETELNKLDYVVQALGAEEKEKGLSAERKADMLKAMRFRNILRQKLRVAVEATERDAADIKNSEMASVTAYDKILSGVIITISDLNYKVDSTIYSCIIKCRDKKILILPAV